MTSDRSPREETWSPKCEAGIELDGSCSGAISSTTESKRTVGLNSDAGFSVVCGEVSIGGRGSQYQFKWCRGVDYRLEGFLPEACGCNDCVEPSSPVFGAMVFFLL